MKIVLSLCLTLVFLVFAVLPSHAALDKKGLMLLFTFENAKGDTVSDLSGGKHDGTLMTKAAIIKTAKYGSGALEITDSNALMQVQSFKELEEYTDNTFLFWIYFSAGSNGLWSQILVKLAPGSDRSPGIWINQGSTGIHYRYNAGNLGFGAVGPNGEGGSFDLKTWYHIVGVKKGAQLTYYCNGVQKGQTAVPQAHSQGSGTLNVGKSGYRAATFYMDDLAVFNRALTADEVKLVMDGALSIGAPVEPQGKLASAWGDIKSY
ncbi:MAG: LamG domain-containing protein [Candidatus Poribacteria bacterium]